MSATMTEHMSRRMLNNPTHGVGQVHKDVNDDRYRDLRRPRKLRFYVNGDRYFRGKKIYVTPNRYYNFNDLLNDLTGKLPSNLNLPYGVRQIFTPQGGRRIFDIEDLSDGETYVCAGFEGFKTIKYGRAELEPWSMARPQQPANAEPENEYYGSYRYRGYANNAFHPGRYFRTNQSYQQRRWPGTFGNNKHGAYPINQSENAPQKPRVITIVKNGPRPRNNVKILLNRRSLQSYEQLISDISEAFGAKQKHGKVRKLFTVRGKEVLGISDFFRDDDCFIALGVGEANLAESDVADIVDELFPDGNSAKAVLKEWEKNQRRRRRRISPTGASVKSNKDTGAASNKAAQQKQNAAHAADKRDSGFDSSDASTNRSEPEQAGQYERKGQFRPKRKLGRERDSEADRENPSETGSSSPQQGYYLLKKIEKERVKASLEEKERAKRRQQKMADAEKRAIDDERRKKGLVPLKNIDNPFKKADDVKDKEREEAKRKKDEERKKIEEEKAELEKKQKEKEARAIAEKAARDRMAAAAEKERQEKEKEEKERKEKEKTEKKKAEKPPKLDKTAAGAAKSKDKDNNNETSSSTAGTTNQETGKDHKGAVTTDATSQGDNASAAASTTATTAAPTEETNAATESKDNNNNNNKQQKEKRKQEREEKHQRKRAKTKIVRKTKEERQVSGDDYILQRYDLGRKLGDGNFAIVRQSRRKETGQEVAIKVIDKAKLKGKEHMVENEIDIMKDCSHGNIVRLYEEYETVERIYLVMELVKGGDLFDAITQSVKFGEIESSLMVKDLCNALFYMHSRSIVHRDLKPENLLVHRNKDGSITLKLADFGLAMEVKESIYTVCGTPTYVAPEILTEIGYGLEVDMWAVGVITYILLCGFPPFRSPDRNQTELFEFIKAGEYEFLSPYWDNTSRNAKDLISRLLIVDRRRRYTAVDVLSHKWVVCNGQPDVVPEGTHSVDGACRESRRELEAQAKLNYESYQRLKEKKKRDREKVDAIEQ